MKRKDVSCSHSTSSIAYLGLCHLLCQWTYLENRRLRHIATDYLLQLSTAEKDQRISRPEDPVLWLFMSQVTWPVLENKDKTTSSHIAHGSKPRPLIPGSIHCFSRSIPLCRKKQKKGTDQPPWVSSGVPLDSEVSDLWCFPWSLVSFAPPPFLPMFESRVTKQPRWRPSTSRLRSRCNVGRPVDRSASLQRTVAARSSIFCKT